MLVAERLAGLPLALEMAGAWVARNPTRTWAGHLDLYGAASGEPFPERHRPIDYPPRH